MSLTAMIDEMLLQNVRVDRLDQMCPKCGRGKLTVQHKGTEVYLECLLPVGCGSTFPAPVDQQLKALGAKTLPGFDLS